MVIPIIGRESNIAITSQKGPFMDGNKITKRIIILQIIKNISNKFQRNLRSMFSMKLVMIKNKVKIYLKIRDNRRKMENIQIILIVYILLITVDMLRMLIKK